MFSRLDRDAERFWFLGRLHSCLNHACPAPPGTTARVGPNVTLRFESRPGRVAVVAVATRAIAAGDEVTTCYATEALARAEGFPSLRAFLRARRLFDCACASCAASGAEKQSARNTSREPRTKPLKPAAMM